jgi:spermidine/putrescine transport system substrate-binding protein
VPDYPQRTGAYDDGRPRRRTPIQRRSFLRGLAYGALAGPALIETLAACGSQTPKSDTPTVASTPSPAASGSSSAIGSSSTSASPTPTPSGGLQIATPTNPVTWPIYDDNPLIADGMQPEQNATLQLYNYADYIDPGAIKSFEKKYKAANVKVQVSTFNDTDEALTKIRTGKVPYDIYFPSYDQIAKMVTAKLIRPLNHSYIPNITNVWPEFTNPWYDGNWQYTVPYTVYTTGIGWRTDKLKTDPSSLSDPYDVFWDPKTARAAVIDDWHTCMAMVLLREGKGANINSSDPAVIADVQKGLLAMQSATHPKVNITMYNDLPAGQVWVCQMWSGDVVNAVSYLPKGVKPSVLGYWFPPDGKGSVDNDLNVILKGGKNPVLAHLFLNHMLDTPTALGNFSYIGYQPPQNSLVIDKVVSDGFIPANLSAAVVKREYFTEGYRLLELPPAGDAAWHQVWARFKAGA